MWRPILLAPVLLLACALRGSPDPAQIDALGAALLCHLERGEHDRAAALFHYPEELSAAERERDREVVARRLAVLSETWGSPARTRSGTHPEELAEIGVFGGSATYWRDRPREGVDAVKIYAVVFAHVGPGFVKIAFHHSRDASRVRLLGFAVDGHRGGAVDLLLRTWTQLESGSGS